MRVSLTKVLAILVLLSEVSGAALISRTYTYTSGNTITANENNTNENTIYTEFNGNIESANIKDGTIANADVADTQFVVTKFASNVQSTFTYVNTFGAYRRPLLKWISATTVDIEANTGTSNQTCVQFPDERRCVTEDTASTSVNRRFIITEVAAVSGTKNSGLFAGEVEGNNLWYALYAVKTTDVATDFVIIGSTKILTQANYATINTNFGTNSWVYLGVIRNGDSSATPADILEFYQSGNMTLFANQATALTQNGNGILMASGSNTQTVTYSPSAGVAGTQTPASFGEALMTGVFTDSDAAAATLFFYDSGGSTRYKVTPYIASATIIDRVLAPATKGMQLDVTSTGTPDYAILLSGFTDNLLGIGFNPQL